MKMRYIAAVLASMVLAAVMAAVAAEKSGGSAKADAEKVAGFREKYATSRGADKLAARDGLVQALLAHSRSAAAEKDHTAALDSCRQAVAIARYMKPDVLAAVEARMKEVLAARAKQQEIDKMIADLQAAPKDTKTRTELLRTYLIDQDDPAAAAGVLTDDCEENLRKHVPLAAKKVGELNEADALKLGRWYKALGDKAEGEAALAMYGRADARYQAFLAAHAADDDLRKKVLPEAEQVKAKLILASIAAAREKDVAVKPVDLKLSHKAGMVKMYRCENHAARKLAPSPCGRMIAVVGGPYTNSIQLWDVAKAKQMWSSEEKIFTDASQLGFTPDGRALMVVRSKDKMVEFRHFNPEDGKVTAERKLGGERGCFSYDGRICYALSPGDWTFTAADFETGTILQKTTVKLGGDFPLKCDIAVSPDGKYVWFSVGKMKLVDTATGKVVVSAGPPKGKEWSRCSFVDDGKLACAKAYAKHGGGCEAHLYDPSSGKETERWAYDAEVILSPDGTLLMGPGGWMRANAVYIRDRRRGRKLMDVKSPDANIVGCCWSADGRYVFLGTDKGMVYLMGLGS